MKNKLLISILLLLCSAPSFARQCWNAKGSKIVDSVSYDLSTTFDHTINSVGQTKELTLNFPNEIQAVCETASVPYGVTVRSYENEQPVVEDTGTYKYIRMNDYLWGAMRINDSAVGTFYPPVRKSMGFHPNVDNGNPFPVKDTNLKLRIKVVKPFIGNVSIPENVLFKVFVTTSRNDLLKFPVYTISYKGKIIAPQSCKINSGTVLDIEFGDILASEFSQAGIGNKPNSVDPKTRSVSVQCSNMNAEATVSFRIESDKSQGDMLVSNNNPDVGFKISDMDDKILSPNNPLSFSKFQLNQSQHATISFKAWPVSVTGRKPALGKFTSRAYIRIDFD
ncbi:fimbrial protein [Acinetobacter bereziniae]|uniref:Fimbrial-type adhesion domain-containing protein n=1 Tax=Acinetobacter bereziniae NIPH 3 TaxID=1217651 RepID=N8YTZ8_ACIBZ|nr:fimbrial protein [Acinetobacter bereziniae]ENV22725.1 hypothetical protein F963_01341 [Acinetobacter bereziniae NIPH 3]